jgi:NADH dehydrogenase
LRVAIELNRLLEGRSHRAHVTLIDQHSYHQHVALLHLVATAGIHEQDAIIPLDTILDKKNVQWHQGRVSRIYPDQQHVVLDDGHTMAYDRLVLGTGTQVDCRTVAGACEHALPLRTFDQAVRLRNHCVACFEEATRTDDPVRRRLLLTVAIVGGGFIGCQFAGELADWVGTLAEGYALPRSEVRIALVQGEDRLLPSFGGWAHREALKVLDRRGVSVYLNTKVERVESHRLYVSDERMLPAATIAWTTGIRAPEFLALSGLPTDSQGRVYVDQYLRVQGVSSVFAAGDCAHVSDGAGGTVPATASYAMRQGEHLAKVLLAEINDVVPRPYEPMHLGHVVSLGAGKAVGDPFGVHISGSVASILKQGIEKWYLTTLQ